MDNVEKSPRTTSARRRRRRLLEWGKTLLILGLACSAVYLVGRTQIFSNLNPEAANGWLASVFSLLHVAPDPGGDPAPQPGSLALGDTTQPVRMAATVAGEARLQRYAVQYSPVDELYAAAGSLLAQCLGTLSAPRAVSLPTWQQALKSTGFYFDFLGEIPLDTLALWLGGGAEGTLPPGVSLRRLCLVSEGGRAALYYINEKDGKSYACDVSPDLSAPIAEAAGGFTANRAAFAFQLGDAYGAIDPNTLLLSEPPAPRVYAASNPLGPLDSKTLALTATQDALLRTLSFHAQTNAIYPTPGGITVNEAADTLRLLEDGSVLFRASDLTDPRFPTGTRPVEVARALAEATIGSLCGSARLYLQEVTTDQAVTTITFGYCLDGAAVQLPDNAPAASFTVENEIITQAAFRFRSYAPTEKTTLVLPELQAVAAATALGSQSDELLLCYEDPQDSAPISATWSIS